MNAAVDAENSAIRSPRATVVTGNLRRFAVVEQDHANLLVGSRSEIDAGSERREKATGSRGAQHVNLRGREAGGEGGPSRIASSSRGNLMNLNVSDREVNVAIRSLRNSAGRRVADGGGY